MRSLRSLTLLWPGLPWVWLRGSLAGLLVACAFALVLDVAILSTVIWTEAASPGLRLGLWTAVGIVWIVSAVSAVSAFPPALAVGRTPAVDALYLAARDAYLSRDWLAAESKLLAALELRPTDGEVQLLLATLMRRVGRLDEALDALDRLARSDSGAPWQSAIGRERDLIARERRAPAKTAEPSAASAA
jgi:tetratricopeptide (TPR) repeat protein